MYRALPTAVLILAISAASPVFGQYQSLPALGTAMASTGGIPLGMPPGKAESSVRFIAPEHCVAFAAWSGVDASGDSSFEKMLAEPEIQSLVNSLGSALRMAMQESNRNDESAEVKTALQLALIKQLLSQPGATYLSFRSKQGDSFKQQFCGAIVSHLGNSSESAQTLINQIVGQSTKEITKIKLPNGIAFKMHRESVPPLVAGVSGDKLILAFGEGEFERVIKRLTTAKVPAWLTKVEDNLRVKDVDRVGNMTYINLNESIILEYSNRELPFPLNAIGIDQLDAVATVTGIDQGEPVVRSWYQVDTAEWKKVFPSPLNADDLQPIPNDARVAMAFRFKPDNFLNALIQNAPRQVLFDIKEIGWDTGLDVWGDFIDTLGDSVQIYESPGEGGMLMTGWTVVVSLSNPNKMEKTLDRLMPMLLAGVGQGAPRPFEPARMEKPAVEDNGDADRHEETEDHDSARSNEPRVPRAEIFKQHAARIRTKEFDDARISYIPTEELGIPMAPAWCVEGNRLIFGTYPQNIVSFLQRKKDDTIASKPKLQQLLKSKPNLMMSVDEKAITRFVYPFMQWGAFSSEMPVDVPFDGSMLPGLPSITRQLDRASARLICTNDGFELTRTQTLPPSGALIGVLVEAISGIADRVIEEAKYDTTDIASQSPRSARDDLKKMRLIGLQLHNSEIVHGKLPAYASFDADKKPLLSWRVHLLQYLNEYPLYKQFKLDEPWDSPHNKALIPKIPSVFQSEGVKDGKTPFVTVRQPNSVMPLNGTHVKFRDIFDGMSNTLMVVRANEEHSVIWTKPDDLAIGDKSPIDALQRTLNGFAVLLADGSTHRLSNKMISRNWKKLIEINDRESSDIWDSPAEAIDRMPGNDAVTAKDAAEVAPERMEEAGRAKPIAESIPKATEPTADLLARAEALQKDEKHDAAVAVYQKALTSDPENIQVLLRLGETLYYKTKQYKQSEVIFGKALKLQPDRFEAQFGVAKTIWIQNRNEESIPHLKKAIELNGKSFEAHLIAGMAHQSVKKHEEANEYLTKAVEMSPTHWFAVFHRGHNFYDMKRYDDAIESYTQALKIRPDNTQPNYSRAMAYYLTDRMDEALKELTVVIDADPSDMTTLAKRAEFYREKGQPESAIADYSKIIKTDSKDASACKERALCWMDLKVYDKAIEDYNKALDLKADKWTYYDRATCFESMEQWQNAADDYSRAIELDPEYANAHQWRGYANGFKLKRFEQAKTDYENALKFGNGNDSTLLGNYAWFLTGCPDEKYRDLDLAMKHIMKAGELTKWKAGWIVLNLSAVHAANGDFKTALIKANEALPLAGDDKKLADEIREYLVSYKEEKRPVFKEGE